jgi:hypothetical protein
MASETAIAERPASLFEIEEDYAALVNTEDLVSPEDQESFKQELAVALKTAVDKRERFGQFILACERRSIALKAEAKRMLDQAATCDRAAERAREYGAGVIESLGTDAKGKYRKLEGNTVVLSLRAPSSRVDFPDEAKVPSEFKTLTITLPATAWERHIEWCRVIFDDYGIGEHSPILNAVTNVAVHTSKTAVKKAIENGRQVEGADLKWSSPTLQIK